MHNTSGRHARLEVFIVITRKNLPYQSVQAIFPLIDKCIAAECTRGTEMLKREAGFWGDRDSRQVPAARFRIQGYRLRAAYRSWSELFLTKS